MIYFLSTDIDKAAGGRQIIYALVDILNANNIPAMALHQTKGFSYTWFKHQTPVAYTYQFKKRRAQKTGFKSKLKFYWSKYQDILKGLSGSQEFLINKDDILVVPESRLTFLHLFDFGQSIVTVSQNPFLAIGGVNQPEYLIRQYSNKHIILRIAMSKLGKASREQLFPSFVFHEVPVFINSDIFNYSSVKKRKIAYMPRKQSDDVQVLVNSLKIRGKLNDYEFVPIQNKSYVEVAEILKESLLFLSFSYREGLGMPPLEAAACGCLVVGYSGNGGKEFFQTPYFTEIEEGDIVSYINQVEEILNRYEQDQTPLDQLRIEASKFVLETYSMENTEKALLQSFKTIIE